MAIRYETLPTAQSPSDPTAVLEDLLSKRSSCRAFQPKPVPRTIIERILSLAQRSASWCNTQPWQVIITSGSATDRFRDNLAKYARTHKGAFDFDPPAEYRGVYRDRRRAAGWQLYEAVGVQRGDREGSARQAAENFRLFGAPHVAIVTTDSIQGVYGAVDSGLYIQAFLLAATSLDVATIPQAALAGHSSFIREHFAIPEDRLILVGISFGYADTEHPANGYRTARASLDDVVTWETE